jgi:hypothetical protein
MQRVRRVAPVLVLALIAGLALAGCRSQPDTAAYVGDARLTNEQLEDLFSEVSSQGASRSSRTAVVQWWVLNELGRRIAADKGYQIPEAQVAQAAQQYGLKPDSPLARLAAEEQAVLQGIASSVKPTPASEEDLRAVYDKGRKAGVIPPDITFEQARPELDVDALRAALTQRDLFRDAAKTYNLTVNPQYLPLSYTVLPFSTQNGQVPAVEVPLGDSGDGAVVDKT